MLFHQYMLGKFGRHGICIMEDICLEGMDNEYYQGFCSATFCKQHQQRSCHRFSQNEIVFLGRILIEVFRDADYWLSWNSGYKGPGN
jgi:hypothetical protein